MQKFESGAPGAGASNSGRPQNSTEIQLPVGPSKTAPILVKVRLNNVSAGKWGCVEILVDGDRGALESVQTIIQRDGLKVVLDSFRSANVREQDSALYVEESRPTLDGGEGLFQKVSGLLRNGGSC